MAFFLSMSSIVRLGFEGIAIVRQEENNIKKVLNFWLLCVYDMRNHWITRR